MVVIPSRVFDLPGHSFFFFTGFTVEAWMDFLLWNRSQIQKVLVPLCNSVPLLHKWAHLTWQVFWSSTQSSFQHYAGLGSSDEASSSILAAFLTLHLRCGSFLAIGFYHPVLMSNQDEWHDPVQFGVSLIKNSCDINLLLVLRFLFGTPTALSSHVQYFTSHFLINYIFQLVYNTGQFYVSF